MELRQKMEREEKRDAYRKHTLNFTDAEWARIVEAAHIERRKPSEYIRNALADHATIVIEADKAKRK